MSMFEIHQPMWLSCNRIWKKAIPVTLDDVEIGDLCCIRNSRRPRIVRVLSINANGTLTTLERPKYEVGNYKPEELLKPNYNNFMENDGIPYWANFWTHDWYLPQCNDALNTFGPRVYYQNGDGNEHP